MPNRRKKKQAKKFKQPEWLTFEEMTRIIVASCRTFFGLSRDEGRQELPGLESGVPSAMDVVAYTKGDERLIVFECRHRNRRVDKSQARAFAHIIWDTRAVKGYFVNHRGLQSGAKQLAEYENIGQITIPEGVNPDHWIMRFLDNIFVKTTSRTGLKDVVIASVLGPNGTIIQRADGSHSS